MATLFKGGTRGDSMSFHSIKLAFFSVASFPAKMPFIYKYLPAYVHMYVPSEILCFQSCPVAVPLSEDPLTQTVWICAMYFNDVNASYTV